LLPFIAEGAPLWLHIPQSVRQFILSKYICF
jgi:hypothetical protein